METADFVITGAGIVGVTIAREIKRRYPKSSVIVLEKELSPGKHSSGRNSGVLHSGIYYPSGSLKAKVCKTGAEQMAEYCIERKLPFSRPGKILIPGSLDCKEGLLELEKRAAAAGVATKSLDEKQLHELEPDIHSATGKGILVPSTAVVNSEHVMCSLVDEARDSGIEINLGTLVTGVDANNKVMETSRGNISYGHVINTAGLHADKIAHYFNVGLGYTLLPFKGIYWKLRSGVSYKMRHLIYPVPNLNIPFLGIHTTISTDGVTYLGPTAVPAFGRENYRGFDNIKIAEALGIGARLFKQYLYDCDNFRKLAWQEGRRYFKPWFVQAAKSLIPGLQTDDLLSSNKVGIRAQMLNVNTGRLVTDFVVERGPSSTHILNAISPAFTCSFPLARYVVDEYVDKR